MKPSAVVNRLAAGALLVLMLVVIACERSEEAAQEFNDYEAARKVFWRELYPDRTTTLYCQEPVTTSQRANINIEHVFPMSWVTSALACGTRKQCRASSAKFNQIEADLHNLYASRTDVNQARGAMRFDLVNGEARRYGSHCDFEVDQRRRIVEPPPASRGNVARAMFYMAYQYRRSGLEIFASSGKVLQQWHRQDPPDEPERARNERIAALQGTRNPFIDDPAKLDLLIENGEFY